MKQLKTKRALSKNSTSGVSALEVGFCFVLFSFPPLTSFSSLLILFCHPYALMGSSIISRVMFVHFVYAYR